jgi:hypothetical protein
MKMFERKKKKTGVQTPEFRKPSAPPPPPTSGFNAVKPNPNYIPPASVKESCTYSTPCGWCTKWDKKCDRKIGCDNNKPKRGLRAEGNVYDDNCLMPKGIIRKIIQEVDDNEDAINKLKEITKERMR